MRLICALTMLAATACPAIAGGPEWIGYGGPEGGRVYADQDPPTKFDHAKGEGVKWETPLPVWGNGSPLAVGGKVFVTCEVGPKNTFPLLVCLDGATGRVLWQREIDHLPAVARSKDEQDRLRQAVRAWFDRESKIINAHTDSDEGLLPDRDKAQGARLKELYDAMGLMRDKFRRGQYCHAYPCMGDAYATPVSDGGNVYVATLWGGFACFDLDGNQKWVAWSRGNRWTWCNPGRSPILYKHLLIYNGGGTMRALDKTSGRLLWSHEDPPKAYGIVTPAVVTIGSQDVLLAAGPSAYRLPDGKPLKIEGWVSEGMQILVHPEQRDVAAFCGSGEHCGWENKGHADVQPPAALRFSLDGDTLRAKVLWHGGTIGGSAAWGGNAPWMVVHGGKFYHREGAILDAMTGRTLAGTIGDKRKRAVPATAHLLCVAGKHVYGLRSGGGTSGDERVLATMQVYTLDGKHVADNLLVRRGPTPEQQAMHQYCTGDKRVWMEGRKKYFAYGYAFTFGDDRIYIRSLESLICIGK